MEFAYQFVIVRPLTTSGDHVSAFEGYLSKESLVQFAPKLSRVLGFVKHMVRWLSCCHFKTLLMIYYFGANDQVMYCQSFS